MLRKILGWFLLSLPFIALLVFLGVALGVEGLIVFAIAAGVVAIIMGVIIGGIHLAFD